jgi:hypothetical protein
VAHAGVVARRVRRGPVAVVALERLAEALLHVEVEPVHGQVRPVAHRPAGAGGGRSSGIESMRILPGKMIT